MTPIDTNFWRQRWETNEIGFHESEANPKLVEHFQKLSVPKGGRVFVPLCGKTLDIAWLLSQGYRVEGAELIEMAVQQLFEGLKVKPEVSAAGKLKRYSGKNIDIFVGDIFDLSADGLGPVDAIYDRAALVALPETVRPKYTAHLRKITHTASQLLLTYAYDQKLMDGPPFSVSNEEVELHYQADYNLTFLGSQDVPGGIRGKCAAKSNTWLLKSRKEK